MAVDAARCEFGGCSGNPSPIAGRGMERDQRLQSRKWARTGPRRGYVPSQRTWDVCMREDMAAGKRDRAWEREAGDATDSARALKQTGLANRRAGQGHLPAAPAGRRRRTRTIRPPSPHCRPSWTACPSSAPPSSSPYEALTPRLCPDPAIAWPRRGTSFCDYAARFWALPRRRELTQAGRRARTT